MKINFTATCFVIKDNKIFRRSRGLIGQKLGEICNDPELGPFIYHEKLKTFIGTALSGRGSELNSILWDIYGRPKNA